MNEPRRNEDAALIDASCRAARRAVIDLAVQRGADVIRRPAYPGAQPSVRDVEPLAGLQAALELEHGAQSTVRQYMRAAREAGYSWHEIGTMINLNPEGSGR